MKTEEERIKSIVDEIQAGPFKKHDVRVHIMPKKTLDEKKEEDEQNEQKKDGV